MKQAVIIAENNLDYMPPEYVENLLKSFAQYPEYLDTFLDLIEILKRDKIIEN
jgi:hypothetical protein